MPIIKPSVRAIWKCWGGRGVSLAYLYLEICNLVPLKLIEQFTFFLFHLCQNVSNLQDYRRDKIIKKMQEMITTLKWLDSVVIIYSFFFCCYCCVLLRCTYFFYLLVRVPLLFADLEEQETIWRKEGEEEGYFGCFFSLIWSRDLTTGLWWKWTAFQGELWGSLEGNAVLIDYWTGRRWV